MVKHLHTTWKTWVRSLGQEDPLEKEIATHSSTLACKILWTEEPDRLQSMGLQGVRHDWATSLTYLLKSCPALYDCSTWTVAHQASLPFTISWSLLKLMSIESMIPSNHLILCYPLLFVSSIFPSIRVFSNELAFCIRWPNYWRFSIDPSNECSRLISFRVD